MCSRMHRKAGISPTLVTFFSILSEWCMLQINRRQASVCVKHQPEHVLIDSHRNGIYLRSDPDKLLSMSNFSRIEHKEGSLLPELRKIESSSVSLFYDACSMIHMWAGMDPRIGLEAAMGEIVRSLKPGG